MNKFSRRSKSKLSSCEYDMQLIMIEALRVSKIDFGISEGHRPLARQKKLFDEGLSKIDGVNKIGKHNFTPSMAVDIYAYVSGKASYSSNDLCYIAGVVDAVSQRLLEAKVIKHVVRWGGNWDADGVILKDQSFDDLCHFELIKINQ